MSDTPDETDPDLAEVERLIRAQLGPETFVNLEVVRNRRYPPLLSDGPNRVVPFQVRAFQQQQSLAGLAPTGRNTVFEGVAISRDTASGTAWDFYVDSLSILADLGVPIAIRPPLPQSLRPAPGSGPTSVPSTSRLAAGLDEVR